MRTTENFLIKVTTRLVLLYPFEDRESTRDKVETFLDERVKSLRDMSPQRKWEIFYFRPIESFNTVWLVYIVVAQTWGFYKTCDCVTSGWGGGGGYLDFGVQDIASHWVEAYWLTGTLLTSSVLGLSMFYITVEWCQQSFLSTEDYEDARQGLRMTRIYRHWTFSVRRLSRLLSRFTFDPMERLAVAIGVLKRPQKTLLWTKTHTHDPDVPIFDNPPRRHHGNPSIELSDFSTAMHRDDSQQSHHQYETPAMAHSLFPPAIPKWRPRLDSDSSAAAARNSPSFLNSSPGSGYGSSSPSVSLPHRPSNDSSISPLLQHPAEAHHQRARAGSATSNTEEEWRSSGEDHTYGYSSPVSPVRVGESSPFLGMGAAMGGRGGGPESGGVQIRQGYARANSDPGIPPGMEGLGLVGVDLERGERRERR